MTRPRGGRRPGWAGTVTENFRVIFDFHTTYERREASLAKARYSIIRVFQAGSAKQSQMTVGGSLWIDDL